MNRYPGSNYVPGDGGVYVGGPFRGVLHSTEGDSAEGAIAAFENTGSWPHLTYDFPRVFQHLDLKTQSAKALEHRPGTVETNRQSAIQIEIVGHAATSHAWSPDFLEGLARVMRWVEAEVGVHPVSTVKWVGEDVGDSIRLSDDAWLKYSGWAGHCHVPNQEHWDPGAVNILALLPKPIAVVVNGVHTGIQAFMDGGTIWVALRPTSEALKIPFVLLGTTAAVFSYYKGKVPGGAGIPFRLVGNTGFVQAKSLPAHVNYTPSIHQLQVNSF